MTLAATALRKRRADRHAGNHLMPPPGVLACRRALMGLTLKRSSSLKCVATSPAHPILRFFAPRSAPNVARKTRIARIDRPDFGSSPSRLLRSSLLSLQRIPAALCRPSHHARAIPPRRFSARRPTSSSAFVLAVFSPCSVRMLSFVAMSCTGLCAVSDTHADFRSLGATCIAPTLLGFSLRSFVPVHG
jgi:hypothetical protein